jgi:hypothetical protein
MRFKVLTVVMLVGLLLLPVSVWGKTIEELEEIALTDFIPEIREAAGRALAVLYLDKTIEELEDLAVTSPSPQIRAAAVSALSKLYLEANLTLDALKEKATAGESPELRGAVHAALVEAFVAAGVAGEELVEIARTGETAELRRPAIEAFFFVSRGDLDADKLAAIATGGSATIGGIEVVGENAEIIAEAVDFLVGFYTTFSKESFSELKALAETAEDANIRTAAAKAWASLAVTGSKLAHKEIPEPLTLDEIKEVAKTGTSAELRAAARDVAAFLLAKIYVAEQTETELIKLVVANSRLDTVEGLAAILALGELWAK